MQLAHIVHAAVAILFVADSFGHTYKDRKRSCALRVDRERFAPSQAADGQTRLTSMKPPPNRESVRFLQGADLSVIDGRDKSHATDDVAH